MEKQHLSAGFVIHNSISDGMLDGHLTLLSINVKSGRLSDKNLGEIFDSGSV